MIEIIQFSITDSAVINEIFDITFTVFLVVIPVKLISEIFRRASRWF